ncbi:uncharacterized protein LOC131731670 [Acipenser ruthenus]|uniref:uncharacterized protein LOC131731670 n=1 Tax=Acipenser ruthenus TaxID=7906 RepID=UPI0027417D9E|nr:uncharacterized protein LOC131731670 [Acipenser ruthenus]
MQNERNYEDCRSNWDTFARTWHERCPTKSLQCCFSFVTLTYGNHKLIQWIVIHGGIDGYSRKIVYLKASNNRASTVFESFVRAVHQFGLPSRVRSDKGLENIEVARFMLEHPRHGPDRGSHITRRSVHNQCIERLWRDVWYTVTSNYYVALQYLQAIQALDPDDEIHMICSQHVIIPRLNMHLDMFCRGWDRHPLYSEHMKSTQQLWIQGLLSNYSSKNPISSETLICTFNLIDLYTYALHGMREYVDFLGHQTSTGRKNSLIGPPKSTAPSKTPASSVNFTSTLLLVEKFGLCMALTALEANDFLLIDSNSQRMWDIYHTWYLPREGSGTSLHGRRQGLEQEVHHSRRLYGIHVLQCQ